MAKLAAERASASEVKAFASHMVTDHSKAGEELKKVATAKGAQLNEQPSAKDQRELDKLSKLQGADFDREYVKVQLAAHKDAVSLFKKEASAGRDSDLKQFASSTLPTLREHLQMVQQLSKSTVLSSRSGEAGAKRAKQS
jgi:putative membrane protein